MRLNDWRIEEMCGYKPISTFYTDMSIADHFGEEAIKDTYERVVESWLADYKMFTEFVMVLNWKIWEHYKTNDKYAELYNDLWMQAQDEVEKHFSKEEKAYYYKTVD